MHPTDDSLDLNRFLQAQSGSLPGCSDYCRALAELRNGRKTSHWMWYVFPQIVGLGNSSYAVKFAIKNLDEAREYLAHPILGPRLVESSEEVLKIEGKSAVDIFGGVDAMKLRSSTTLFKHAAAPDSVFSKVLEKYYAGQEDDRTLQILEKLAQDR